MSIKRLSDCYLYGILDLDYIDISDAGRIVSEMISGGVDIIQLRGKAYSLKQLTALAAELHTITSAHGVPFVINDYAKIAFDVPLEGVHVGQNDRSVAEVRKIVKRPVLVGKSTHSFEQALAAKNEGADYIGFGPLFATPTKPDYPPIGLEMIPSLHASVSLPIFCIGGIKRTNLKRVIAAGAQRVVIVSELLQSENIEAYAKAAKAQLSSIRNQQS
jgi:thiamine-phosphate pyrophosphorylase